MHCPIEIFSLPLILAFFQRTEKLTLCKYNRATGLNLFPLVLDKISQFGIAQLNSIKETISNHFSRE